MEIGQYNSAFFCRLHAGFLLVFAKLHEFAYAIRAHIIEADTIASVLTTACPKFRTIGYKMCELACYFDDGYRKDTCRFNYD